MGGTQIVHTVCMDTRDAVRRKNGEFTFRMAGDNPRIRAIKVGLGSLEFPMVQWSVEESRNSVYYSEGITIDAQNNELSFSETSAEQKRNVVTVRVPSCINEIVDVSDDEQPHWKRIRTAAPHGLYHANQRSTIAAIDWADVEIVCTTLGRISLTSLMRASKMRYVSETEFAIEHVGPNGSGGFVCVPTYPSPAALCDVLTRVLTYTPSEAQYEVVYDAPTNRASFRATRYPENASALQLVLYGSPLAKLLGYTSATHERTFRRTASTATAGEALAPLGFDYLGTREISSQPPLTLPSESFGGWNRVTLPAGWYVPAHRTLCPGQPLRLPTELEHALNRLYFAVPERIPQGQPTAHFLMYTDPAGNVHNCPVYPGKYSPDALAKCLETEMTRLVAKSVPGTIYTVDYDATEGKYTFACEVRESSSSVRAAPFSLLFAHPAQFDPSRIGFAPQSLYGQDSYTSTQTVYAPANANVYRVSEDAHQQRLRVHSVPAPQLMCVVEHYDTRRSLLRVRTYSGQLPFVHGLRIGTPVIIGSSAGETQNLYNYSTETGEWAPRMYSASPVQSTWGRSAIVVPSPLNDAGTPSLPSGEHLELWLRVKPTAALVNCTGTTITLQSYVEPFNLCFGLPNGVSESALGFPHGATQWGIDGSVQTNGGRTRIPPFHAPNVHNLDHPDYVLIYLDEAKPSSLQHQRGSDTTCPFAKIVLFPTVREERMLPRDTMLLSGESLSTFTLRFVNPDGTPYEFHGAHFSFSLNFIKYQDS